MHKSDPGIYTVTAYDAVGRKRGQRLRSNVQQSARLAERWRRLTGGTATIHKCIANTGLPRPFYSKEHQA